MTYILAATLGGFHALIAFLLVHEHFMKEPLTMRTPPRGELKVLTNTQAVFASFLWPVVLIVILCHIGFMTLLQRERS